VDKTKQAAAEQQHIDKGRAGNKQRKQTQHQT
jgi:hypothetical protein